jgi:uncharacterized oxidoreductase
MVVIEADRLKRITEVCFKAAGCSEEEAKRVSELLVLANLRGHDSHGAGVYIPAYIDRILDGRIKPGAEIEIVKETPSMALINGNFGVGQMNATKGMEIAIKKAKENGVGIVSIYNCNHIGRMADYTAMALEHGMIGYIMANVGGSSVAPHGGMKGVFGTNPLCYAIPAGEEEPIMIDFATSFFAGGKLSVASARGEEIPDGALIDHEGYPTKDPSAYWEKPRGVLLPFGGVVGYKGYGLCLAADILGGALSGSGCASKARSNGVFMMTLNISNFRPLEEFEKDVDMVIRECKNTPPAPGYTGFHGERQVLVPGDPERIAEEKNLRDGIYIDENTWKRIEETAEKVGVDLEKIK